ncbi:hypothetical protein [Moorena bouillonii]|uniref:hypothetical protein n=1 Tax=Moorena bouillonii TaxID=207920 RepID=UPI0013016430|nr:hypothetical protein [Moorena bouillonii]
MTSNFILKEVLNPVINVSQNVFPRPRLKLLTPTPDSRIPTPESRLPTLNY